MENTSAYSSKGIYPIQRCSMSVGDPLDLKKCDGISQFHSNFTQSIMYFGGLCCFLQRTSAT
jgi:hypothetical protein